MATILVPVSTCLHVLATVVFVGYFFFTGLIYVPVLERCMDANSLRDMLEQVSARLRPFFGGSLLVFLATGTYLMFINPSYQGLGNFFSNPWSALIVIKHALVLGFLGLAVFSERAYMGQISALRPAALKQFQRAMNVNTCLGVIIVLMTAFAQAG